MTRGLCGALGYDYEALHGHLSFTYQLHKPKQKGG